MIVRPLDERVLVGGQIGPDDIPGLAAQGVTMIVNNRPDGEEPGQPLGTAVEAAAIAAGLAYRAVPIGSGGLTGEAIAAMADALDSAPGKTLAFCRSGTRSTYLWALARARQGVDGDTLVRQAAEAGYDLTPIIRFL